MSSSPASSAAVTITRRPAGQPPVLSLGQQRLWYLDQLSPGSAAYNIAMAMRMEGNPDLKALKRALDAIVARHEVLRTVYLSSQGRPLPVVLRKFSVELKEIDLRHLPAEEKHEAGWRAASEEATRPFNLGRDVLLRAAVIRLTESEGIFLHASTHIAFEGTSIGIFYRELDHFYDAFTSGREPSLPELPLQYSDFALWQRERLVGERLEQLTAYWREQLSGAAVLNLSTDFPRPALHTMTGKRHFFVLPPRVVAAMNQFFTENKTSPYRGLCAVFVVLMHAYTRATDISVGSPFALQRVTGIEDLIGFFVNTVVIRTSVGGGDTFREMMHRVSDVVRGAIQHSDLTFDKIVDAVRPPRDPSRTPLFQLNFRAPKAPYPVLHLKDVEFSPLKYIDNGTSKFDLALEIESSKGEHCYFEYRTDLFKESTIAQMVTDFEKLLDAVVAQPDIPISQLAAFSEVRAGQARKE